MKIFILTKSLKLVTLATIPRRFNEDGETTLYPHPVEFPSYRPLKDSPVPRVSNDGAAEVLLIAGTRADAEKDPDALQWEL